MTIQGSTVCNLIQTFPVLLILAQKQNRCLETHFVYKPPTPTQSPEYYMALDALFQNLYGNGYPGSHEISQPCYSSKYGSKLCPDYHGSHGTVYGSHYVPSYGSHGIGYGSYGTRYGSHGVRYGSPGTDPPGIHFVPSYRNGNIYSNVTYGHGYASTQSYTANNRYKVVVKKTKIGTKRKRKSEKLRAGFLSDIKNTVSDAISAVGSLILPQNRPVSTEKPSILPNSPVSSVSSTETGPDSAEKPSIFPNPPVSAVQTPNLNEDVSAATGGGPCTPVNGGEGECINLRSCQPYMAVMKGAISNPVTTWMLRQAHCGFDGDMPKVCCPINDQPDEKANQIVPTTPGPRRKATKTTLPQTTSTLPPTTSSTTLPPTTSSTTSTTVTTTRSRRPPPIKYDLSLVGDTCRTVYNTTGSCMDIYLCEPFLALVKTASSNPAATDVLKKSACGFKRQIPQVCCPLPGQSAPLQTMPETTTVLPSAGKRAGGDFLTALPEPPVCGFSNISFDRVVGGIPAKLGAFPWMALLGYRDLSIKAGFKWMCGGALISSRHVLTAAHCIHHQEDNLFKVRLGELDLDRVDEGASPIDVPIKAMYKHELYTKNNPVINDIGVLVLDRDVEFTDLIRPICLFTASTIDWRSETFEDYNPFVAGWGALKWAGISASHLQVAQLPVLSAQTCENVYSSNLRASTRPQFAKQALCAGFLTGKIDSCSGDSGGPLMQPIEVENLTPKTYLFAIGVVSFGSKCAQAGFPGVYARVSHYMPWIEEKVLGRAS